MAFLFYTSCTGLWVLTDVPFCHEYICSNSFSEMRLTLEALKDYNHILCQYSNRSVSFLFGFFQCHQGKCKGS